MRLNGHGALSLEDARTWMEETGLCLFLPKRQFSTSVVPSFVEAVAGQRNATPDSKHIAEAEHMLVRLENDGVAVRLNLLGVPGEQPDFVVAAWVLPYVYALRGDRDWRRSPQLTGSRQVSPLAVQAYKMLETGDATVAQLKHALGREVTEAAVIRAITELWQQLRIIPVIDAPGQPARWQPLRQRFQKAIAEGASTSQVTAISVLASIYLQAVIAGSMEDVEVFLSPLTSRSKIREVIRGLVATRQVHTINLGHTPHYYVAGTLPEFSAPPAIFTAASLAAYLPHAHEEDYAEPTAHTEHRHHTEHRSAEAPVAKPAHTPRHEARRESPSDARPAAKSSAPRTRLSRPAPHNRDRKPTHAASTSRSARRPGSETRSAGARPVSGARKSSSAHSNGSATNSAHSKKHSSGATSRTASANGSSTHAKGKAADSRSRTAPAKSWSQRNGHSSTSKSAPARKSNPVRKDARTEARGTAHGRKPALAGAKAGASKRYGFAATAKSKPTAKKRG